MIESLRVAVAEDETEVLVDIQEALESLGHQAVIAVQDGESLVLGCRENEVDLIITDIQMPELDGLQAAERIREFREVPIIIISAFHDESLLKRAIDENVLAYLIKPIRTADLETSIELAVQRFKEMRALQDQAASLEQALADRKIIERAKGILMQRTNLSEAEAFRRLQNLASEKNQKMVRIAQTILDAEEAFKA